MGEVLNHKTKKLFRTLVIANKKISERDSLREGYADSMSRIKEMVRSGDIRDREIIKELEMIEQYIARLVLTERSIAKHVYDEKSYSNRLVKSISRLQKDLNKYLKYRQERQKKIQEIEAKIAAKGKSKKSVKKKATKKNKKTVKKKKSVKKRSVKKKAKA